MKTCGKISMDFLANLRKKLYLCKKKRDDEKRLQIRIGRCCRSELRHILSLAFGAAGNSGKFRREAHCKDVASKGGGMDLPTIRHRLPSSGVKRIVYEIGYAYRDLEVYYYNL